MNIQFDPTISLDGILSILFTIFAVILAWWLGRSQERGNRNSTTIEIFSHLQHLIFLQYASKDQLRFEYELLRHYDPILLSKFGCYLYQEGTKDEKNAVGNVVSQAKPVFLRIKSGPYESVDLGLIERIGETHIHWAEKSVKNNPLFGFSITTAPEPLTFEERREIIKKIEKIAKSHGLKTSSLKLINNLRTKLGIKKEICRAIKKIREYFHSVIEKKSYDLKGIVGDSLNILANLQCLIAPVGDTQETAVPCVLLLNQKYCIEPDKILSYENNKQTPETLGFTAETLDEIWKEWIIWMNDNVDFLKELKIKIKMSFFDSEFRKTLNNKSNPSEPIDSNVPVDQEGSEGIEEVN